MYITKGIIVDTGAAYVQNPLYDDKLKVRIPEIHGMGELVKSFQEEHYTKDEDLPWCTLSASSTDYYSYYPVLAYKAQNYGPADMVYVQVEDTSPNPSYLVIGIYAEYHDGTDPTLTIYNNIDVTKIIENNVDFPEELLTTFVEEEEEEDKNPDEDYDNDNTVEEWKYFFSNPIAKESQYYVSWEFGAKHPKGYYHAGIDLAGKIGTPIYATADGKVLFAKWNDAAGNIIAIKHVYKDNKGKSHNYYSVYEHLNKISNGIKSGTSVKGAHYISDTEWKSAYTKDVSTVYNKLKKKPKDWDTNYGDYYTDDKGKHKNTNPNWDEVEDSIYKQGTGSVYNKLKKKPKDWDNGGWTNYYKKVSGHGHNAVYDKITSIKQTPTQIGERGNKGSTCPKDGPHLHFGITTIEGNYYRKDTAKKNMGGLKNPRNFISFKKKGVK